MGKHHYFVAVKLPAEVKAFLQNWVKDHQEEFPFGRWVHPEDFHITLAFLGFAEEEMKQKLVRSLPGILGQEPTFTLKLNKIGTFGAVKKPRIFWADTEHSDDLNRIQQKVYRQCIDIGFELDKKPFRPHITLARKWNGDQDFNPEKLTEIGGQLAFTVNEVVLYETHLDQTPKYVEYAVFPLR
ncbi:RNA 2',3'-cyclic phosphodiesterase [Lysinibacillus yapensis]|uniref:RNA 2',3'-cyclic phosphodiesterase n=1 Tax=Ureibacillus yapensis TaxID=2304605 RepID=UPI00131430AA|nr:RNA 2',3'-cyclic phosphodiesterase [Lysinibacillus yapensis]